MGNGPYAKTFVFLIRGFSWRFRVFIKW